MKRWQLSIHRHSPPIKSFEDRLEAERVLSSIEYRGVTHYETKVAAAGEANFLLAKLASVDPSTVWKAIWCFPFINFPTGDKDEGKCFWKLSNRCASSKWDYISDSSIIP